MLTTVRHIFGRIMHSETALHGQWDKGRKNNLLFASSSIRRPTRKVYQLTGKNSLRYVLCRLLSIVVFGHNL